MYCCYYYFEQITLLYQENNKIKKILFHHFCKSNITVTNPLSFCFYEKVVICFSLLK